ncbi:DUF932 domain-containing protein [bacterium]|nr:DUF932 domain-containing protein [bacterium]
MNEKIPANQWLFAIEEAPVFAAVTHNGATKYLAAPHRKALIAADSGRIVGIVGDGYRVFTNQQAVDLCQQFCRDAFPDTTPSEWIYELGHGPSTRSWAAMDIRHRSHTMNLMGIQGGESEVYTPFARITNSYNGSRALRIDVGFMRKHCENGVIFEQEAATVSVPHTREGIHAIKVASPFSGMAALCDKFRATLNGVRAVGVTRDEARSLVRLVIGWPQLPKDPKPTERTDQESLDADLELRLDRYFHELGENAYAAFNTMTDIAARPPQSTRFRRDRPNLERRAGAWLRDFNDLASRPGFTLPGHLKELAGGEGQSRKTTPQFRRIPA